MTAIALLLPLFSSTRWHQSYFLQWIIVTTASHPNHLHPSSPKRTSYHRQPLSHIPPSFITGDYFAIDSRHNCDGCYAFVSLLVPLLLKSHKKKTLRRPSTTLRISFLNYSPKFSSNPHQKGKVRTDTFLDSIIKAIHRMPMKRVYSRCSLGFSKPAPRARRRPSRSSQTKSLAL